MRPTNAPDELVGVNFILSTSKNVVEYRVAHRKCVPLFPHITDDGMNGIYSELRNWRMEVNFQPHGRNDGRGKCFVCSTPERILAAIKEARSNTKQLEKAAEDWIKVQSDFKKDSDDGKATKADESSKSNSSMQRAG